MNVVSIMQPTYLPWTGYFELISKSEHFIFLNDAKFEKSSWVTRNQVIVAGKPCFLTVPTVGSRFQSINEVMIQDSAPWRKKHLKTLDLNYSKSPYFKTVREVIESVIMDDKLVNLSELNMAIIVRLCEFIGIGKRFYKSSQLNISGVRTARLVKICNSFNADIYYSPLGSKEYMMEDGDFTKSEIQVRFQDFVPKNYFQFNSSEFISHLSVIDLLFNHGQKYCRDYLFECSKFI